MPKIISATEAKVNLGAMIDWAVQHVDEVIIQSYGQPKAVLVSYEAYERIQHLRETARRQEALARLDTLAEEIGIRNQDLTQETIDELAQRFSHEVIDEMIREGKIRYKGA